METENAQHFDGEKETRHLADLFWCYLRFIAFTAVGLYVCMVFGRFSLNDPYRVFLWLPPFIFGLFLTCFGMGLSGHWRYLWAIGSIPALFIGLLWFFDKFHWSFDWLPDWLPVLPTFIGSCVILSVGCFIIAYLSYRRWPTRKGPLPLSIWAAPALRTRIASIAIAATALAYCLSYVRLSLAGRYEPEWADLLGVHDYFWAPRGFSDKFVGVGECETFYFGLWQMDKLFWHTNQKAYNGKYPVGVVKPEDLDKLYREWDAEAAARKTSPDNKYQIWIRASGIRDKPFIDRAPKTIRVAIVKNVKNMDGYGDSDVPPTITFFTNEYRFSCSDVCFETLWDKKDNVSVILYDFGPDTYREDARRSGSPSNRITALSFVRNEKTGKFQEEAQ